MKKPMLFAAGVIASCLILLAARRFRCRALTDAAAPREPVDLSAEDSFPASDPPSYTGAHV